MARVQLLSLVNCADTIVGDGMMRGVSGGEKKRVTTGEIVVGPSKVLFMDEISTGANTCGHLYSGVGGAPLHPQGTCPTRLLAGGVPSRV